MIVRRYRPLMRALRRPAARSFAAGEQFSHMLNTGAIELSRETVINASYPVRVCHRRLVMWFIAFVMALAINCASILDAQTPKFDVATIKSNRTGSGSSNLPVLRHGRMTANNVSLLDLLDAAYGFTSLTTRGPDWLNT